MDIEKNFRIAAPQSEVWEFIKAAKLPYHWAYDVGMPRLSCVFCIYATNEALELARFHNEDLYQEYVRIENLIKHDFKFKQPIANIRKLVEEEAKNVKIKTWCM